MVVTQQMHLKEGARPRFTLASPQDLQFNWFCYSLKPSLILLLLENKKKYFLISTYCWRIRGCIAYFTSSPSTFIAQLLVDGETKERLVLFFRNGVEFMLLPLLFLLSRPFSIVLSLDEERGGKRSSTFAPCDPKTCQPTLTMKSALSLCWRYSCSTLTLLPATGSPDRRECQCGFTDKKLDLKKNKKKNTFPSCPGMFVGGEVDEK